MKILHKLILVLAFTGVSSPAFSSPGSYPNDTNGCKHYVEAQNLQFSSEGIFLKDSADQWQRLAGIHHDDHGYYLTSQSNSLYSQRAYIVACRVCRTEYANEAPQPCRHCNQSKGFDVVYIGDDYWDR